MLIRNSRIDLGRDDVPPIFVLLVVALAAVTTAFTLPAPWNVSATTAICGLGFAAWGDWKTQILWDEIVVGTLLVCAGAMCLGGQAAASVCGGTLCGLFAYTIYFVGLFFQRETGFGDVKLAAAIGFALGPASGIFALGFGAALWLLGALIWAVRNGVALRELRTMPIPFGPGLALGLTVAAWCLPLLAPRL
jgi:prepilin signal peptidase PulO-like enzyme (type II secretory pathway)